MSKKADLSDNRQTTGKRRATSTSFKPGQTGNPKGAPKRGTSWTEVIKWTDDSTPGQLVKYLTVS